jgi:hypothetical protein
MNTSWTNAALLQRRPICIALLLSCFFVNARAQVTVWQENFAGANQGWTDNFVDCDGTMQSFAGVNNGRYEVTDMEGAPCCTPNGGGNENEWVTNPIDIEDYCSVDISVTYGFVGTFECSAGGPYFGCQANPTINNGHDQIVFEYSINGGAWVQFGYVCGGQTGTVTATGLVGNDIRIRIRPSNKSTQETYWFDNVTVTGNVGPTVNQPADVTACANTAVNVPFTGSAGATFSWTNNNTAIGLGASGTGNINFTTANVGAITTGTITVTPINGCNGQPVTFDITVNPIPLVNDPPNQAVCSNEQVNVIFTGNAGTYNWTNSNPAIGLPASGSGDLNFTATTGPATGTITVQPVQGACIGTAQTFTITINTAPVINAVADVTVCGGGGVNTIFTGTPGAQYTWTNSNPAIGLAASGTGNVVFTSANPANVETGTITVTPAIGTCQGNPEIFTVTVNPTPTVVDPPNQTVCSGEQVDVVFNGNGGPAFNWTNSNTAIGLGAEVRIFDNNVYKLMRLQNKVGRQLHTSVVNPVHLKEQLLTADVAIGAVHSAQGRSPMIVSEEIVSRMKPGSVILDVSIDQGGCFETSQMTTHDHPTYEKYGVTHYCVPNIPSRVARTASDAISNILTSLLLRAEHGGVLSLITSNEGLRNGVYTYKGCLTNAYLGALFQLKSTNLDLLITSDF